MSVAKVSGVHCKNVSSYHTTHGLRTPYEGINQRNLKFWADVANKICFGRTYKFGIGIWFSAVQWRRFPHRASVVRGLGLKLIFSYPIIWLISPNIVILISLSHVFTFLKPSMVFTGMIWNEIKNELHA